MVVMNNGTLFNKWRAENPSAMITANVIQKVLHLHTLRNTDFSGIDLSGANLANVDFTDSLFSHCNCRNANFAGSDFTLATFKNADFSQSILVNAGFNYSDVFNSDFSDANLEQADFTGTYIEGSTFPSDATLTCPPCSAIVESA